MLEPTSPEFDVIRDRVHALGGFQLMELDLDAISQHTVWVDGVVRLPIGESLEARRVVATSSCSC